MPPHHLNVPVGSCAVARRSANAARLSMPSRDGRGAHGQPHIRAIRQGPVHVRKASIVGEINRVVVIQFGIKARFLEQN